jgi:hypothetical protein
MRVLFGDRVAMPTPDKSILSKVLVEHFKPSGSCSLAKKDEEAQGIIRMGRSLGKIRRGFAVLLSSSGILHGRVSHWMFLIPRET